MSIKKSINSETFLLRSNIIIVLATSILLLSSYFYFQRRIESATLNENRFLTTEWHLLQELKEQTDIQLREKDVEIRRLRAEYERVKTQDLSVDRLVQIEQELQRAEEERAAIVLSRINAIPFVTSGYTSKAVTNGPASEDSSFVMNQHIIERTETPLTQILAERIKTLEAQSAAYKLRAETAEAGLSSTGSGKDTGKGLQKADATLQLHLVGILEEQQKRLDGEAPASLEAIRTRSLLRALVSSPAIRADYPDLLESLDHAFNDYGRQERIKGSREAFTFTIETVKALSSR